MKEKIKVNQQTASKIGLFGAVCLIISAVVGIGAFFKNGSVFSHNNGNAAGVMCSWIIAAAIALFTAFSFAEIVTVKNQKNANAGLAGWTEQFCGYNLGRAVKVWQPCFYYIIKVFAMGMFASAAMFQIYFSTQEGSNWFNNSLNTVIVIMLVGFLLIALFIFLNYISVKFAKGFSQFTTIVKFIPFAAIIIISIVFGILTQKSGWTGSWWASDNGNWSYTDAGAFNINGVFGTIPAILFAFDSFLVIGNVAGNIKDGSKNVSLAVVISMCIAVSLEVLITIGELTIGTGDPYQVFYIAFHEKLNIPWLFTTCCVILSIFILIAALGVLNSLSMTAMNAMEASIQQEILFGSKKIKQFKPNDTLIHGTIYMSIILSVFFLAIFIPSAILNTDQIFDGISNLAILFFFMLYGTVALFGLVNRKTKKNQVDKFKLFIPSAIISVVGCYFAFGYCAIWQFCGEIIKNPGTTSSNSWGLSFLSTIRSTNLVNWQCALVFWSAAIVFISFPFINDALIKLTDKKYTQALIWEKNSQVKTSYIIKR